MASPAHADILGPVAKEAMANMGEVTFWDQMAGLATLGGVSVMSWQAFDLFSYKRVRHAEYCRDQRFTVLYNAGPACACLLLFI